MSSNVKIVQVIRIIYSPHLKRRVTERKIPKDYPKKIYERSKTHYFDNETQHRIALSKLEYAQRLRLMAAVYDKIGQHIEIVTVFPISENEFKNKVNSGRWEVLNEKN